MYTEDRMTAYPYRVDIKQETVNYLETLRRRADKKRQEWFRPVTDNAEAYANSLPPYRAKLISLLGRPLTEYDPKDTPARAKLLHIGTDEYGTIWRLWVEVAENVRSYGLLFLPKDYDGNEKYPLAVCLHGGGGTPEIVSSFYNSANYRDMVRNVQKNVRAIVYAPQIMLWFDQYVTKPEEAPQNKELDIAFKYVGSSMASFEIFKILRAVDWIEANRAVDRERIGIVGLSYGGFYTLLTSAVDDRFCVTLPSCSFNTRYAHSISDWTVSDEGRFFNDAEIASLICPRPLCIQVGEKDPLFDVKFAIPLAEEVQKRYEAIGCGEKFRFAVREGGHQFTPCDTDFFAKWIKQ